MFNIGFFELVILAVIGLIVLGPEQLPEMARKAAKLLNELKRVSEDIMSPVDDMKEEAKQLLERSRQQMVAEIMNKKNAEAVAKSTAEGVENNTTAKKDAAPINEDDNG